VRAQCHQMQYLVLRGVRWQCARNVPSAPLI
jgi:hypothetical protein